MAQQLKATKLSTPIRDVNDADEKMEASANTAQNAIVNANRPYYATGESAAKAGPDNTKVTGGGMGAPFNPKRS